MGNVRTVGLHHHFSLWLLMFYYSYFTDAYLKTKNGLSGLLIIFWRVISNIVLVYVKLFCAHANKWDLTNRPSHVKGEDAEICCGAVQTRHIHVCVSLGRRRSGSLCPVFRLCGARASPMAWDVYLFACLFQTGLFWLPRAVHALSLHLALSKFLHCP